jgi:hypothetical protein
MPMRTDKAQVFGAAQLVGVRAQGIAQVQGSVASALCVILVRDRRAEERHDAVAGVLVDGAFEAVHAVGEDLEEALEDAMPRLGIELLGELRRALHVGEEHGDLLALAFERSATAPTEAGAGRGGRAARAARAFEAGAAGFAERGVARARVPAGGAVHRPTLPRGRLAQLGCSGPDRSAQPFEVFADAVGAQQSREAEHRARLLAAAEGGLEETLARDLDGPVLRDLADLLLRELLEAGRLEQPQRLGERGLGEVALQLPQVRAQFLLQVFV